ncbi:hypothetical protein J4Q44_G00385920 [Coregonus suidteri]|uniref:Uncharacterized protein n=1 Tax=Coregonus suidteri TaxID=861788 RepID=A0AAN8KQY0_9TELE
METTDCLRPWLVRCLVEFSPSKAGPRGGDNTLQLSAQPGSLCGLSTVDKSVHIMEPGKRLDADKKLGLKLATNLVLRVPSCLNYKGNQYHRSYVVSYYSHM